MRFAVISVTAMAVLAACEPPVPNARETGVGFGSSTDALSVQTATTPSIEGPFVPAGRISDEEARSGSTVGGGATGVGGGIEISTNNPSISDEQDFGAVASRESIESDRERLAAQRNAFQLIQPSALPTRRSSNEPSVVEFALSTNHARGVAVYARPSIGNGSRFDRNCAKYGSPDQAQTAFLKAGGPTRDRFGIDPDGDGYACYWDPTPFRAAVNR